MRIRFDKVDGFIAIHDGTRYLVLLSSGWYDAIYNRITYAINKKSRFTDSNNRDFARIKIDSYHSLPIEKILTFHNVIALSKSVINKNNNNYYHDTILEKRLA